mmetsp:Transcript_23050/g.72235  ORF Transcript_23050/g.72235 Transcript_23050/m.72235 type:complete len:304 (+) Transcript_23050:667-1578(+)
MSGATRLGWTREASGLSRARSSGLGRFSSLAGRAQCRVFFIALSASRRATSARARSSAASRLASSSARFSASCSRRVRSASERSSWTSTESSQPGTGSRRSTSARPESSSAHRTFLTARSRSRARSSSLPSVGSNARLCGAVFDETGAASPGKKASSSSSAGCSAISFTPPPLPERRASARSLRVVADAAIATAVDLVSAEARGSFETALATLAAGLLATSSVSTFSSPTDRTQSSISLAHSSETGAPADSLSRLTTFPIPEARIARFVTGSGRSASSTSTPRSSSAPSSHSPSGLSPPFSTN